MLRKQGISAFWKRSGAMRWFILGLVLVFCASLASSVQATSSQSTLLATGEWLALSSGTNGPVYAIAVNGSDVYVGGMFSQAGTCITGCNNIAKWNMNTHTWSALDGGTDGAVYALAVRGNDLFVGGTFSQAGNCTSGCNYIAMLTGLNWTSLGSGMNAVVKAIAVDGTNVYVGGEFTDAGGCTSLGCYYLALWSGSSWFSLGSGVTSYVYALAVADHVLYVGGIFGSAGGVANTAYMAKWDAGMWYPINGSIADTGIDGLVRAIAVNGDDVYAAGSFSAAGSVTATNIVHWNGSSWLALPSGAVDDGEVYALALNGSNLYVGGHFHEVDGNGAPNYVAKWNGVAWSPLGIGTGNRVHAVGTSGSHVFVGGIFNSAGGVANTSFVADYYSPSSDATLSNLVVSQGTLSPQFASTTTVYTAQVNLEISQFSITPTATDTLAVIRVNGTVVASGSPSGNFFLYPGDNLITILVTAQDEVTHKTYSLTVTRDALKVFIPYVKR